jgi:hypothetical protein
MCGMWRGGYMNERETVKYPEEMTNEEYRIELNRIFSEIRENYILRWFYLFIMEKTKSGE